MKLGLLGLILAFSLNMGVAATITGGSQEAIIGGIGRIIMEAMVMPYSARLRIMTFQAFFHPAEAKQCSTFHLSNGQTTQTLLSVPSYVSGLTSLQL